MEFYFTYKHEYNAMCCRWTTLSCFTYRFRAHSLFIYVCYISVAAEENLQKQMQGQRLNIFIVSLPWNFIKQIKLIKKYVVPVTKYTMWILFFPDKLDKEYKMQRQKKVIRVDKVMQKHIFQNVRNPFDEKKNEKHVFRNDDKPNIKWFDNKFNINFPTSNHLHRPFHIRRAPIPSIGVPWPKPQKSAPVVTLYIESKHCLRKQTWQNVIYYPKRLNDTETYFSLVTTNTLSIICWTYTMLTLHFQYKSQVSSIWCLSQIFQDFIY